MGWATWLSWTTPEDVTYLASPNTATYAAWYPVSVQPGDTFELVAVAAVAW